jgi:O-antigen/teichoic acid export membrane protein
MTLLARLRNNSDFAGAVITGYAFVALNLIVQISLVPLYISRLGSQGFGLLMVMFSMVGLIHWAIRWLQGNFMINLVSAREAGNRTRQRELCFSLWLLMTLYALFAIVVSVPALLWFGGALTEGAGAAVIADWPWIVFAFAVYVIVLLNFTVEIWILMAARRQSVANLLLIAGQLGFLAIVIPYLLQGGGVSGVMLCMAAGNLAAGIAGRFLRARLVSSKGTVTWFGVLFRIRQELLGPGTLGFFVYGGQVALSFADVMIIGFVFGADTAGSYVLVWKIAEVAILLIWRIGDHLKPELVAMAEQHDRIRLRRVYRDGLWMMAGISLVGGLIYALIGQFIVATWVGTAMTPDSWIAYALAGGAIFWLGLAYLSESYAYVLGRIGRLATIKTIEIIAKLGLMAVLFDSVGTLAPLVAINVIHVLGAAAAYLILGRSIVSEETKA